MAYTVCQSLGKDLMTTGGVTFVEFTFFRCCFILVASVLINMIWYSKNYSGISQRNYALLAIHAIASCICALTYNIATIYLPLSILFVIMMTNPFLIGILAVFWLNERMSFWEVVAMFISFIGVMILTFSGPKVDEEAASLAQTAEEEMDPETSAAFEKQNYALGVLFAFISAFSIGTLVMAIRKMQDVHYIIMQINSNLVSVVAIGVYLIIASSVNKEYPFTYENPSKNFLYLTGAGFANLIAQILMTNVNQSSPPATVGVFAYIGVVYSGLFDVLLFVFTPSVGQVVGILICGITNIALVI